MGRPASNKSLCMHNIFLVFVLGREMVANEREPRPPLRNQRYCVCSVLRASSFALGPQYSCLLPPLRRHLFTPNLSAVIT